MAPESDETVKLGIVVIAVASLAYALLIVQNPFLWASFMFPVVFLYLLWRLVRAQERIAMLHEQSVRAEHGPDK